MKMQRFGLTLYLLFTLCCVIVVRTKDFNYPCVAIEALDDGIKENWDFRIPHWYNVTVSFSTSDYNIEMMSGIYTYEYTFCESLNIYIGNSSKNQLGWSFGSLSTFVAYDARPDDNPSPPASRPGDYTAFREFTQYFIDGDYGAPCSSNRSRTAIVNVYCGIGEANCTQVPGNKGAHCLDSPSTTYPGFCLCGIEYNTTYGICSGLTLNLLSNLCPSSKVVPMDPLHPYSNEVSRSIGIAFAVIGVLIIVAMIGGYIYNCTVHSKTGCQAVPFYDTCTGQKEIPNYSSPPPTTTPATPVYGSFSS